jgi:hypothetical protein
MRLAMGVQARADAEAYKGDEVETVKRYLLQAFEDDQLHVGVYFDVDWGRESNKWRATSDLGHVAHADSNVGAALACFALRLGVSS